ncbi:cysteine/glutathione ABC transporter permease/ATP-binding protein CydD [Shewanella avicenniae]|uniref:Cysteine/glutathione ABC transporter permease/ATP-binding protein CydD n=1 Tax=Shewanella avicenniae TaxID=2814294 RepID=A0ABX7QNR2_9GAMM|nr:cysteine/glutathione ABC transporter permease/ATP-binding protein CydD [Shewanella avicenniae]QSX33009.1 cysteine/glutathione ABC transporter permease/ATP-binding protein CydD [Shewanella avicenniae]
MDKSLENQLALWLRNQKGACGVYLKLSMMLGVLNGALLVVQAWLLATVLHGVIIEQQARAEFVPHIAAFALLIGLRALVAFSREKVSFEAGLRLRAHIREVVLSKLTRLGPAYINGKPAGAWASIVLEQIEDLQDFYARYLPQMSLAGFIPLIILCCAFPLNWAAGLILLITAPLIPLFMILVGMGAADANRRNFSALQQLSGHFMDRLKALSTLKLFNRAAAEERAIAKASEEFRERTMAVLRLAFLSSAVLEFFAAVSIAVLAVYFGFSYLGELNFGHYGAPISLFTGMFILIMAPEFYQPLRDLGSHYHAKAQAIGAAEALMELLNAPEPLAFGDTPVPQGELTIVAENFSVLSMDGVSLVGPLSFTIQPQQKLALVGPSGAGKTSLLNALLGFLPYEGSLRINGIELKQLDIASWRQRLGWLGQNPQLFHGSIADNLRLGQTDLTDDALWHWLKQARVDDFVHGQPNGLQHTIGEFGAGLSVGQAQRLSLARTLAKQAPLLLLDEPSASLDSQNEQWVLDALWQALTDKSCLMITHRLDQLDRVDEVWVMQQGAIVQQGTLAALSAQPGVFQQMLAELPLQVSLDQVDTLAQDLDESTKTDIEEELNTIETGVNAGGAA